MCHQSFKDRSLLYTGLNNVITMSADAQAQNGAKPSTSIAMTTPCDVILVLWLTVMLCSYITFNDNGKYSIGSDIKSKDIKGFHKDIHVPFTFVQWLIQIEMYACIHICL